MSGEVSTSSQRSLCYRSFLSIWSYPNLFRAPAKELCDLLVVFGDDVVIFSDKSCTYLDSGDPMLDWSREALTISKDDLGRWCDDHGRARPAFWFGDDAVDKAASGTVPSRDDEIGKRIQAVINAAAEKRKENRHLSMAEIARVLALRDTTEKFEGYGFESIRKILKGTFGPAKRRGIRGLGA